MSKHLTSKSCLYTGRGKNDYIVIVPPVFNLNKDRNENEHGKNEHGGYDFSIVGIIRLTIEVQDKFQVYVTIHGVPIGCFEEDFHELIELDDGITISFDAWAAKGYLRFYSSNRNNRNYIWVAYDLQVPGGSSASGSEELFEH